MNKNIQLIIAILPIPLYIIITLDAIKHIIQTLEGSPTYNNFWLIILDIILTLLLISLMYWLTFKFKYGIKKTIEVKQ